MSEEMPIVEAVKLTKHFALKRGLFSGADRGAVRAVDGISFAIPPGKTLGVVGESGCGKTTTAKLVLLLEEPTGGSIRFLGKELGGLGGVNLRDYRKSVQAVFQDPFASLNPRMRVGTIIAEPLVTNEAIEAPEVKRRIRNLLELVGLPDRAADLFPHEFSGGQRQRIAIARSLAVSPKLIVLDEPVSALDVSIRAQILNLLRDLQAQLGVSYLFIAHDLAAVAHMSHEIAVMYLGQIVEMGLSETVARDPKHPYTQALFSAALPSHPEDIREDIILQGEVPSPGEPTRRVSLPSPMPLRHAPVHGRATAAHARRGAPDRLPPVRSEGVSDSSAQDRRGIAHPGQPGAAHRHPAPRGGIPARLYSPIEARNSSAGIGVALSGRTAWHHGGGTHGAAQVGNLGVPEARAGTSPGLDAVARGERGRLDVA
jgi:ABC-type oligopeptide transport system ATPase subunit